MYEKISKTQTFVEREKEILAFWKENGIFEKSVSMREGAPLFTFFDGPPTANGKPHIGHILTRAIKDLIPRYKTMKGFHVLRKAGWDTHGLPVELEVEKMLGIDGKPAIEKYGVEPFIQKCKESVWKYKSEWEEMSDRVGFWADMENPYITYDNSYIESVWWAIKKIWDQNLLYKGHRIVPYCPRCGTALSSHEVAQGYKDVKEKSAIAKFKVQGKDNEYILAWTTTPWTLPSNVALAVNAKETYARVSCGGDVFIMAEGLLGSVLSEEYEVLETMPGADLQGMEYEPLFPYAEVDRKGFFVVCDNYVTLTDGTGVVHIAPAFGEDDARVGKIYDLPFVQLVDERGNFVESVTPWAGMFVKDADPLIIKDMKMSGKLFKALDYEHNYPFCWRCDTPLLYYARDAWFIRMTEVRDRLVKNNSTVNWYPDNVKQGRFGNFLENVIDWSLSRERYWGTPLPIWECDCGHRHAIGSVEELMAMGENVSPDIELHKPFIDNVLLNCPQCQGKMKRIPEVIDCWFDSGAMPFAQHHYPFENKEVFEANFPANFISEAIDQTRGWFYTLMAISTLLFDKAPYENVVVLGHVQDKDGQKMSKHKGNVVNPWDVLDNQGADAVRWYFYSASAPWIPNRFHGEAVSEGQRKFIGTLWNTYTFYVLYANIDEFDPTKHSLDKANLHPMDKWVLSRLNTVIKTVDENMEQYKITEAARALTSFTDELSNWYVRRCRERFWASGLEADKVNAYMTLHTVLVSIVKLTAPFTPFIADAMYQNLVCSLDKNAPESVHLCDYPVADAILIDAALEKNMGLVLDVVVLGRAARNTAAIKNRQPIGKMYVQAEDELSDMFAAIAAEELNVKAVEQVDSTEAFTTYKYKPQLKTLGKKLGKLLPRFSEMLNDVDANAFMAQLKQGEVAFNIDGTEVAITLDDLLVETTHKEGFVTEQNKGVTVVIDTNMTEELIEEGFVREVVSKIQTMRKEAGFEVLDRIRVTYSGSDVVAAVIERNADTLKTEVLADALTAGEHKGYVKDWSVNGEDVTFSVEKA